MGQNICKSSIWSEINIQDIERILITQEQKQTKGKGLRYFSSPKEDTQMAKGT